MDKTLRYTHEQFSANQQKYYQSRAEWMAYCIQIGFATKEEIPELEKLWDYFKHPDSLPPPVAEERTFTLAEMKAAFLRAYSLGHTCGQVDEGYYDEACWITYSQNNP